MQSRTIKKQYLWIHLLGRGRNYYFDLGCVCGFINKSRCKSTTSNKCSLIYIYAFAEGIKNQMTLPEKNSKNAAMPKETLVEQNANNCDGQIN